MWSSSGSDAIGISSAVGRDGHQSFWASVAMGAQAVPSEASWGTVALAILLGIYAQSQDNGFSVSGRPRPSMCSLMGAREAWASSSLSEQSMHTAWDKALTASRTFCSRLCQHVLPRHHLRNGPGAKLWTRSMPVGPITREDGSSQYQALVVIFGIYEIVCVTRSWRSF